MPENLLRIAAHNGAPVWGGAEIAVSRLLAGLQARGHAVTFFVAREPVAERARSFGLDTSPLHVGGDVAIHHSLRVARALHRHGSQVLIAGTFRKLLHVSAGARLAGVPVVARIGLQGDEPRNAKYRFLFRRWVDRVVVQTRDMQAEYLAAMPELEGRVLQIATGIEPPQSTRSRQQIRAELGLPADAVVLTALARLVPDKRIERFIDVVAALPGAVGVVAGDGPMRESLRAHARASGARISFLGHTERVGDLLAATDILVIPSRREGMANAMLEAMAAGVPVVSTPVHGAAEVLNPDDEPAPGVVARDFDVESLVAAVKPLVNDAELRTRMGDAARHRVQRSFGMPAMVDAWERLLLGLAG